MQYLIIYSHSNPGSFTSAVSQAIEETLLSRSITVDRLDLYAERFDPVLLVDSSHRRRDLHLDSATASYRDRIQRADHLIFVYPVWWHGLPAILKGFIDRVIASEFVYSFKKKSKRALFPEGLMPNKKVTCFYTLDAPYLVGLLDPGWLAIKHGLFRYCGFRHVKRFFRSGLKHTTQEEREQWLAQCRRIAARL